MEKRKKALDIFRESEYVFAKCGFDEAFPEIAELRINVQELRYNVEVYSRQYGRNISEFVNCNNRLCYNGGFSIGDILRQMVAEKEAEKDVTVFCQGYEGSPKGMRRYRNCMHRFKVHIDVKYK